MYTYFNIIYKLKMSSNMFDQVLNDATGIQDKLLGPTSLIGKI